MTKYRIKFTCHWREDPYEVVVEATCFEAAFMQALVTFGKEQKWKEYGKPHSISAAMILP